MAPSFSPICSSQDQLRNSQYMVLGYVLTNSYGSIHHHSYIVVPLIPRILIKCLVGYSRPVFFQHKGCWRDHCMHSNTHLERSQTVNIAYTQRQQVCHTTFRESHWIDLSVFIGKWTMESDL